jgi:hypothetical protein
VLGLAAFGPFSGDPKIDDLGHQGTRGKPVKADAGILALDNGG